MLLDIVSYPDERLKNVCAPITAVTPELRTLAENMIETMYDAPGVGLAAPQVGQFIRMLVMDPRKEDQEKNPRVLINPELEFLGKQIVSQEEGCLSVPMGYRADVKRSERVHLKARDLEWREIDEYLEGFPAIVVQHEADHLDGILFIDHLNHLKRAIFENKVKKWMRSRRSIV